MVDGTLQSGLIINKIRNGGKTNFLEIQIRGKAIDFTF